LPAPWREKKLKLNLGGGFAALKAEEIREVVSFALEQTEFDIVIEPGRYLTQQTGIALGRICAINTREDRSYLTTNLSKSCHLRWLGSRVHYQMFSSAESQFRQKLNGLVTIAGPTCFEEDILVHEDHSLREAGLGDMLAIFNVSGYSYGWNHSFNGIGKADVQFWMNQRGE
jgi:diaminopimelate decarboxylase